MGLCDLRAGMGTAFGVESPEHAQGAAMERGPYGIIWVIVVVILFIILLRLLGVI